MPTIYPETVELPVSLEWARVLRDLTLEFEVTMLIERSEFP